MPVDAERVGTVVAGPSQYEVGREVLRDFAEATAVGTPVHPAHVDRAAARALGHADVVASPTFAAVVAQRAEADFVLDPSSGVNFSRVVHGEQRIAHERPILAGDVLSTTVVLESARAMAGNELVTLRSTIVGDDGALVATATSLLVVRAPEPA